MNYICHNCGKGFKFKSKLSEHNNRKKPCSNEQNIPQNQQNVEESERKNTCNDCGKVFQRNWLLQRHKPSCRGHNSLECKYCNKAFSTAKSRWTHENRRTAKCLLKENEKLKDKSDYKSNNKSKGQKDIKGEDISDPHSGKCSPPEEKEPELKNEIMALRKENAILKASQKNQTTSRNSVYLLIEREFIASKQNIFKIGRTANICNRTRQYPKGSQLLVVLPCIDSCVTESNLQRVFCGKFIQRRDIGSEYYQGSPNAIIKEFIQNVEPHF